jgi:multidrug efflux pump subunit AcrA (membrane-fusion protein)
MWRNLGRSMLEFSVMRRLFCDSGAGPRLLLAGVTAASLSACQPEAETAAPQVRPVRTVTVVKRDAGETVSYTGRIQAENETRLAFRISGRMVERPINVGDHVEPGQVVARLEPQDELNALRTAQAGVAAAQARLNETQNIFERQKTLLARDIASRAQFEQAEATQKTARAQLDTAEARQRDSGGHLDRVIVVFGFDQNETEQLLLGLGKGTVEHDRRIILAQRGRRRGRQQARHRAEPALLGELVLHDGEFLHHHGVLFLGPGTHGVFVVIAKDGVQHSTGISVLLEAA